MFTLMQHFCRLNLFILPMQGQAPSVAAILVRLAGTGHTDAVVRINRAVRAIGRGTNRRSMTRV